MCTKYGYPRSAPLSRMQQKMSIGNTYCFFACFNSYKWSVPKWTICIQYFISFLMRFAAGLFDLRCFYCTKSTGSQYYQLATICFCCLIRLLLAICLMFIVLMCLLSDFVTVCLYCFIVLFIVIAIVLLLYVIVVLLFVFKYVFIVYIFGFMHFMILFFTYFVLPFACLLLLLCVQVILRIPPAHTLPISTACNNSFGQRPYIYIYKQ